MEHLPMNKKSTFSWGEYKGIPIGQVSEVSNIRQSYDSGALEELAESIHIHGQLEPILVYEEEGRYCIITGHRRVRAMRWLERGEINAIVLPKPNEIECIYIQANENEQAKTLTGPERESYVMALLTRGERRSDICAKLCMKRSWISRTVTAYEFRQRYGAKFAEAGIDLDTGAAYKISNAPEEALDAAIAEIRAAPERKRAILDKVAEACGKGGKRHGYRTDEERVVEFIQEAGGGREERSAVTENLQVNRKTQTITLKYVCGEGVDVVGGLSEVIRQAAEEYFRKSHPLGAGDE